MTTKTEIAKMLEARIATDTYLLDLLTRTTPDVPDVPDVPPVVVDPPEEKKGFRLLTPVEGYVAKSPDVALSWADDTNPDAVYDTHIYYDKERTRKVTGTDGVLFDTNSIKTAKGHTFKNDPSDGGKRYGVLWQWPDENSYRDDVREEILFEYTAFKKAEDEVPDLQYPETYARVEALGLTQFDQASKDFTQRDGGMLGRDGYFNADFQWGCAQAFRASGKPLYLSEGLATADKWMASGKDLNNDGYLDWWDGFEGKFAKDELFYNYFHHEMRAGAGLADLLIELMRAFPNDGRIAKYATFLSKHVWEKWEVGNKQTSTQSGITSNISTQGIDFVGRITMVALALDIAQANGVLPSNGRYREWMDDRVGVFYSGYLSKYGEGKFKATHWINGKFYGWPNGENKFPNGIDTSHATDLFYALFRAIQLGYDLAGRRDEFLAFYVEHVNAVWFPDSKGWATWTDGTGGQNNWNLSRAHGQAIAGNLTPELLARWVDLVDNNKPSWSFHPETGNSRPNAVFLMGCVMSMLTEKLK